MLKAISLPETFSDYLATAHSSLNPANVGYQNYVYGDFPLLLISLVVKYLPGEMVVNAPASIQRALATTSDILCIMLVMAAGCRLYGKWPALIGGFFSAFSVLQIQQSHFGTFDTLAAMCMSGALVCAVYIMPSFSKGDACVYSRQTQTYVWLWVVLFGVFAGLGAATKISALIVLPWLFPALQVAGVRFSPSLLRCFTAYMVALVVFRVMQPYAFQTSELWNLSINSQWWKNLEMYGSGVSRMLDYPPQVQWVDRAVWYAMIQMVCWGMGLVVGIFAWISWALALVKLERRGDLRHWLPVSWVAAVMFVFGIWHFAPAMRYQIPGYPWLYLLAGWSCWSVFQIRQISVQRSKRFLVFLLKAGVVVALLSAPCWAWAFCRIYGVSLTRIAALDWMMQQAPTCLDNNGKNRKCKVAYESNWDDPLPAWLPRAGLYNQKFSGSARLEPYGKDSDMKMDRFRAILAESDYLIITSSRQWGSLGRLPDLYPQTQNFYRKLMGCPDTESLTSCYARAAPGVFRGSLGYELAKVFTSFPGTEAFEINDQKAEESFTVYDHPKVFVFKHSAKDTAYR